MKVPTELKNVKPKTANQHRIFDLYEKNHNLYIKGTAGTGKSFISMYLGLKDVLAFNKFREMVIIRSTVPTRKQGFLPGNDEEKNEIFEIPYEIICSKLLGNENAYKNLKSRELIRFLSTSYLRGTTFEDALIFVDEVQNFNDGEINTVMTRLGQRCQIIICGDTHQNDLVYMHEDSCIDRLDKTIAQMPSFKTVEMEIKDIQRNDVVREWIVARSQVANTVPEKPKGPLTYLVEKGADTLPKFITGGDETYPDRYGKDG